MRNNLHQNWHDAQLLGRLIVDRFMQDRCLQIAANLTFTTLLSLVPLITIALTMFSAFPVFDDFSIKTKEYLESNMMPAGASAVIAKYLQQFTESATKLTAMGIVFLVFTAMSMMLTIDHAFNLIWRVTRPRALFKKLVVYWAVLTLAPLLIGASLSLTSWLVGLSMGYVKQIPLVGVGALKILPTLFTTLAFTLLFQLVPNRYVPFIHALIGALVAAILFESMNLIFGSYIKHFPTYTLVYGAFAAVPIFLMWIYLSWITILLGAVIAASLSYWRKPPAQHLPPVVQMLDALRVLKVMEIGFEQGKEITFPLLSDELGLGYDALEIILERLQCADMVRKAEQVGWLLMRDTRNIYATELLRLFVLDHNALVEDERQDPLQSWLSNCVVQLENHADVTLYHLFESKMPAAETRPAEVSEALR
jgi:membrane protein